jgi:hypothetical protein
MSDTANRHRIILFHSVSSPSWLLDGQQLHTSMGAQQEGSLVW